RAPRWCLRRPVSVADSELEPTRWGRSLLGRPHRRAAPRRRACECYARCSRATTPGNAMTRTARFCRALGPALPLLLAGGAASAERIVIHAGNLIDGRAERALPRRSIVVDGNRIVSVETGFVAAEAGDRLVDLS